MSTSFELNWRGVAVRGTYDPKPADNRLDRVVLMADVPLFADRATRLVKWIGPFAEPLTIEDLEFCAEIWLDDAAHERGFHPDDVLRRQLSLFD